MTGLRRITCLTIVGAVMLAGAFIGAQSPASAATYSVPVIAKIVATVTLNPDLHAVCLLRSESPVGGQVGQRGFCYLTAKPDSPPPPPPPPYAVPTHRVFTASFNATTGQLTIPVQPCGGLANVFAVKVDLTVQLSKTGGQASGAAMVTWDYTAPFDCAEPPQAPGSLTFTPLSTTHDQDLDGCTDWSELGSSTATGGLRDPFNMWDYMNPSLNATNRTKDTTAVRQHFGHDANPPGDPLYGARYDRGGSVPGANPWNLLPPNGTIRTQDITAAVNSFGHDCPAPPYTGIGKTSYSNPPISDVYTGPVNVEAFPMGGSFPGGAPVDWPSAFPSSGQAYVGEELVNYTLVGPGPTFTISPGGRGQGGTTATSHPAGTIVWVP